MLNRRKFTGLLGAAALPLPAYAAGILPFYASTGPLLTQFDLDVGAATLARRGAVTLPANLQYAWPHPSGKFLYACASNSQPPSGPVGVAGGDKNHYAIAYRVGTDGALSEHGERRLLSHRPLHITTDGKFLFIAYNNPSQVTVHRLNSDGSIGDKVAQRAGLDFAIYAHQVRLTPGGKTLTLCTRGNDATATTPEDPGHIQVYGIADGKLSNLQSLAPHGQGLGFGPRHLDFSRDGRFVYVSLERQNSLCVYGLNADGTLGAEPMFIKNTLLDPDGKAKHFGQTAGPIHVHPGGRFVYQTNRGSGTIDVGGRKVWNGGENSVAVWKIDPRTGEPTRIQNAPAHGFELRTFTIDPSGKVLIAASTTPLMLPDGSTVSAGLSVWRIGADGKLTFARKYDADTNAGIQFWCGLQTMA